MTYFKKTLLLFLMFFSYTENLSIETEPKKEYTGLKIAVGTVVVGGAVVGTVIIAGPTIVAASSVLAAKAAAAASTAKTALIVIGPTVSKISFCSSTFKVARYLGEKTLNITESQKLNALIKEEQEEDFEMKLEEALKKDLNIGY